MSKIRNIIVHEPTQDKESIYKVHMAKALGKVLIKNLSEEEIHHFIQEVEKIYLDPSQK